MERKQPPIFPVDKVIIPEALEFTLENEIPVFLIDAGTEDLVRIEFTFKAGMVREYMPLLASTTNKMLSEGSQNYTSEEINRLLDYHGAFLNLLVNKDCAGIVIYLLNKHIEKVLELCREILFRPLFPEQELTALLKKRLIWYRVNRERVSNRASDQFFESVFGKHHPYGRQVHESDFERISPTPLHDFHTRYYTPENMAIIVSGKIQNNTIDILNLYFGDSKRKKLLIKDSENHPVGENRKKVHIDKPGTVQTAIRIGSSTINKRHPDYPGLKVLDSILGGYFSSRLMKNIREDKGFTYGINSSLSSLDLTAYKVISTEVNSDNYKAAIDEIYKEIRILQKEPVGPDEMNVVKNYMLGEMLRMFDGPFALAESFRSAWEFGLDSSYYYRLAEKIKTIGPDEIIELANTYYKIEDMYEITVGSK